MQNYRKQLIGRGSDGLVHHPIKHRQIRLAFTLVELLVVIAIIALLLGILIPAVSHARRNAEISATNQAMNNASLGIKTYHNDFNAYPPSDSTTDSFNNASTTIGDSTYATFGVPSKSVIHNTWKGSELLAQALVGLYSAGSNGDFHTGQGWAKAANAKVYGPYLNPGEHGIIQSTVNTSAYVLADAWDQPIQYYRANNGQNDSWGNDSSYPPNCRFNANDNNGAPGASNDPADESVLQSAKFLLISIGPDGKVSTSTSDKTLDNDNVVVTGP